MILIYLKNVHILEILYDDNAIKVIMKSTASMMHTSTLQQWHCWPATICVVKS